MTTHRDRVTIFTQSGQHIGTADFQWTATRVGHPGGIWDWSGRLFGLEANEAGAIKEAAILRLEFEGGSSGEVVYRNGDKGSIGWWADVQGQGAPPVAKLG